MKFILFIFVLVVFGCKSQNEIKTIKRVNEVEINTALSFKDADKNGLYRSALDSTYKSAIHTVTSLAVFKTETEQQQLLDAYTQFLQNFGKFLKENGFKWTKTTRCFNKVYFNKDGKVDYFLFDFGKSEENHDEFERLLNLYIKDNKIGITAETTFSQCGPAIYEVD